MRISGVIIFVIVCGFQLSSTEQQSAYKRNSLLLTIALSDVYQSE